MLLALFIAVSTGVQAQINTTTYKGHLVVPQSVVVQVNDNFTIQLKGSAVSPREYTQRVATSFNARVQSRIPAFGIEEWTVSGDIENVLGELNAIPGVKAFPNYVFQRPELNQMDMRSIAVVGFSQTPSDAFASLSLSAASGGRTIQNENSSRGFFTVPAAKSVEVLANSLLDENPIYSEDFNDSTRVDSTWSVADSTGATGSVWTLVEVDTGDSAFVAGDLAGAYLANSNTTLMSPYLDMQALDPMLHYSLSFDQTDALEGFGFDELVVYRGYKDILVGADTLADRTGNPVLTEIVVNDLIGQDSAWVMFQMFSDGVFQTGFGALVDNVQIFQSTPPPTDDPLLGDQWGLNNDGTFEPGALSGFDVNAFAAWETQTGSDDVIIAVYDDGVDFSHPDLADNAWVNPGEDLNGNGVIDIDEMNGIDDDANGFVDDFWGWSPILDTNDFLNSGSFHGTHVAGIAGAQGNNATGVSGVSQDVSIISVMIFDDFGFTNSIAIMYGYYYLSTLLDAGVDITAINQSWGGGRLLTEASDQRFVDVMTAFAQDHAEHGSLWVISSGNDGGDRDNLPFYSIPNNVQSPNIINVANVTSAGTIAGSSDVGIRTVDIAAPGTNILSTFPPSTTGSEYAAISGTSMAAPHVAGAIALAKAQFPDETGHDLMVRVLATSDLVGEFASEFGEGNMLNAGEAVAPTTVDFLPSHGTATFHMTFVDFYSVETVGFVNNSGSSVDISSIVLSGTDAGAFAVGTESRTTVPDGGAVSVPVTYTSIGPGLEASATLTFNLSDGSSVVIELDAREQGYSIIDVFPGFEDAGDVPYGTELSYSFSIFNDGTGDLNYGLGGVLNLIPEDGLFREVPSNFVPAPRDEAVVKTPPSLESQMDLIYMQVTDAMEGVDQKLIDAGSLDLTSETVIFSDSLNDAMVVDENWTTLALGSGAASAETWELVDLDDMDGVDDNVFFVGDFDTGYLANTVAVAVSPQFNFSGLLDSAVVQRPAYLEFDYAAELETDYDLFFINVIQEGVGRLATIAATDLLGLINDGTEHHAMIDISEFAGLDGIEFWFIMNSDFLFEEGWGAYFDNVSVSTTEAEIFPSQFSGTIPAGGSDEVDVTIKTGLLPEGEFVFTTFVESDALNALFFTPTHDFLFNSKFVNLTLDPEFIYLGYVDPAEQIDTSFTGYNTGVLDIYYEQFSGLFLPFSDGSGSGAGFTLDADFENAKTNASFSTNSARGVQKQGGGFNLVETRSMLESRIDAIRSSASFRAKVGSDGNPVELKSQFVPSVESETFEFGEDFEEGIPETFTVEDFSFGLGSVWDGIDIGEEGSPMNIAGVVDFGPDGFPVILNSTTTILTTPVIDLTAIGNDRVIGLEFDYGFFLEPFYDVASVWVLDEFGFNLLATTEDILYNDGFLYSGLLDITDYYGESIQLVFVVESDESVESVFAFLDNIAVFTDEAIVFATPDEGEIAFEGSQEFDLTIKPWYLYPGDYFAVTGFFFASVDEEGVVDIFDVNEAVQVTEFSIYNNPPVAVNDTLYAVEGDLIPLDLLFGYALWNDFDPDGGYIDLYDATDPVFGTYKYLPQLLGEGGGDGVDRFYENTHYQAPSGHEYDWITYIIGDESGEIARGDILIHVFEEPSFVTGTPQQFVVLEDHSMDMNTFRMAAGVGGIDGGIHVWAESESSDIGFDADAEAHTLSVTPADDFWGQVEATLYIGDDFEIFDSLDVMIVVTPVNDAPEAGFTSSPDGSTVTFTDISSDARDLSDGGIVSWEWSFGDGATSNEQSPVYDYGATGEFDVTLTVTDTGGLTDVTTRRILITSVSTEEVGGLPTEFALRQNYPNPFNPSTNINYSLPEASKVTIVVYDMLGQRIAELVNAEKSAGYHTVSFDASALSSGVYIYQIRAGSFTQTRKMMLIK